MLELSTAARFATIRAAAEAAAAKSSEICVGHVFLGLLKLAEMPLGAFDEKGDKASIKLEIELVNKILKEKKVESKPARSLLRRVMRDMYEQISSNSKGKYTSQTAALFSKADHKAQQENLKVIPANVLLQLIIDDPPPVIMGFLKFKKEKKKPKPAEELQKSAEKGEMPGREFLPELTEKIRNMRYFLLEKVFGQDHAVHTFTEGMFNAEILAYADEERKRPRAIFVFCGPPGIGKTYLSEQAAEVLNIPFKRFDMSGFSDHQQHIDLVGFSPSYKDAKEGMLTGFVKKNPQCILLFDEIEKAHLNCIQLFLQILDAGTLQDKFTDKNVDFRDTVIIFTTNAGRQLYEEDTKRNNAGIPRKTILNALETDIHPNTGKPFFPAAICSRLATGYPIMFNHLQAHDLESICTGEFKRNADLFTKQYEIKIETDELLSTVLLFSEGGHADARALRSQAEMFFKNEIYKLCRLFNIDSFKKVFKKLETIRFEVETDHLKDEVSPLFTAIDESPEILLFTSPEFAGQCRDLNPAYTWHNTLDTKAAFKLLGERDIRLVLFQPSIKSGNINESSISNIDVTMNNFDNVPMAASALRIGREFFRELRERLPELPVYLLESPDFLIDEELEIAFIRAGARGKLQIAQDNFGIFEEEIEKMCSQLYLQQIAANLAAERKVLYFETAPKLDKNNKVVNIRLRNMSLKRALSADDSNDVLDDVEKPDVKFDDVIGASGAKDELKFFVDYLKNPKKFTALGLKPPKGVLLHGPPGTGKTMLAKAMAGESDVAFIPAVASSFVTKWQGSGPEAIRNLFKKARRYAPAIVFIDEIDAVGRARGAGNTSHGEEMALNALLTEMDGFSVDPKRPVFVLAATNFEVEEGKGGMGQIDAALARRFDRKILVDLPDKAARQKYLELKLGDRKACEVSSEMIERLAGRSTGMSLAHMESVIELAARMAAKKSSPLTDPIIEEAFELTKHGEKKAWGSDYLERVARHEAGHAYMYWQAGNTPAYLTIVARGGHGGYMEHSDDENSSPLKTKDQLIRNIRTSLGGRAAETVYYGEKDGLSTGASGDLEGATRIARAMICSYGMDEEFGLIALSAEDASRGPLAAKINERISTIIKAEMTETVNIISKAKTPINKLVKKLLEKNRLTGEEINKILNKANKKQS